MVEENVEKFWRRKESLRIDFYPWSDKEKLLERKEGQSNRWQYNFY